MMSSALMLCLILPWSLVSGHSLVAKDDEDTVLDGEFHRMIGIPHRSEEQDDLLANIEMNKLINEGVIKQADVVKGHADDEDALDAHFHKLIGVPHRSDEQDDLLADMEMKKLVNEGKIKQEDVDLITAMDSLDNLMNTAQSLNRKQRSTSLNYEEILESIDDAISSVTKAGEKVIKNKVIAFKLLEKSKFHLLNVAKALHEKEVTYEIDEKLKNAMKSEKLLDKFIGKISDESSFGRSKRSGAEKPKIDKTNISLNDMLKGYQLDKNVVKVPTTPLRQTRSAMVDNADEISLNDMLKGFYSENNAVKVPSAPLRETRSVENADGKFSSALDAATMLDQALAGLYEDPTEGLASSSSRKKRNSELTSTEDIFESDPTLVTRGYSEEQYKWLLQEFKLTKDDVDAVKALNDEQFSVFHSSLLKTPSTPENVYTVDDLVGVLKSARQLVPSELEAAAYGAMHMGYHLGGRARVTADPMVRLMSNTVVPGAKKMYGHAVDSVPDDVKEWAGEGQRIAAIRVKAVAEYAGPRLTRMGKSMARLQEQLSESAEDTLRDLVPKVVPALRMLVDELRDTLELAREVIPPMMQKVGDRAVPLYQGVRDTMSEHVVQPVYEYITSDTVARPVGQAVDAVSPLGRAVYHNLAGGGRVVYDGVSPVLGDLADSSGEMLREQVLPVVQEFGVNARHQAGRVGETMKALHANTPSVRDVLKNTLDSVFDGVPKIIQQVSHEVHDAAKVFRGRYSSALGKMRSRQEQEEEQGGPAGGQEVTSVSPPVFRPSKAPKRTYVTSTEL